MRQNVDVLLEGAIDLFTLAAKYSQYPKLPYLFLSGLMNSRTAPAIFTPYLLFE